MFENYTHKSGKEVEIGNIHLHKYGHPENIDLTNLCLSFNWSVEKRGFGSYAFYEKDGKLMCMNECDDKEKIRKVLYCLVDKMLDICELEDEPFKNK